MSPKVILISLDGTTASIVNSYLNSGVLEANKGLGLLKSQGVAAPNETITQSLTAPSHIAIVTGSTAANNDEIRDRLAISMLHPQLINC